jgi:formylglycine-generating enzyme required for sulfatase activity
VRSQPDSLLLRADELDAVKVWVSRRKPEAPEITDLQRAFLKASEQAEVLRFADLKAARTRTRRTQVIVVLLVSLMMTGLAARWKQAWLKEQAYWVASVRGHVLTAEAEHMLKPSDAFKECTDCPEMVVVPADSFTMGSSPGLGDSTEQPAS